MYNIYIYIDIIYINIIFIHIHIYIYIFYSVKMHKQRCLTCPKFVVNKTFISNLTKKSFFIINYSWENISCPASNLIYVLTCSTCNIQHIVETALPLHKRINIYRSTKFCSEYMIKNFRNNCCGIMIFYTNTENI